jgi:AcrR family transcriptional regulator
VLARVRRAAWRLEQAEREQRWALASAREEKVSVRKVAEAAGLSPTRVHQLTKDADLDVLDAALGQLRAAGWPAPEDPDGSDDEELSGRPSVAERLQDEVGWLRQCAEWLDHLDSKPYPPAANLRPDGDFPDTCAVPIRLPKVAAVLRRIAFDVDELTRARRVDDLQEAKVADDPRAKRRRRLAEPDLEYAEFRDRTGTPWRSTLQGERAWTAYQAERRRRGETDEDPFEAYNPFRQSR